MAIFALVIGIALAVYYIRRRAYEKTEYFAQTHHSYGTVNRDKGTGGEYDLYRCLSPLEGYKRFLFNCYLPKEDGETTEADVILLHESGIYVFESKNYSGWIFGSENQTYWTQTLPAGRSGIQKYRFFNPIIQNEVHMKCLQRILNEPTIPIYSYIVFGDNCALKDVTLTSGRHFVTHYGNVLSHVMYTSQMAGEQLLPEQIDVWYEKLFPFTQVDDLSRFIHGESVRRKREGTYQWEGDGLMCPRCGGRLLLRTASKGPQAGQQFWGCSNYPRCRYTQRLANQENTFKP